MTKPTNLDLDRTLGDLVAENPARADILESLGLDFCCGGASSLRAACVAAGLDAATVARLLAGLPAAHGTRGPEPDVLTMTLTELVDHLVSTHHAYMRHALPRLAGLADKVTAAHGATHDHLQSMRDVLAGLTAEIERHLDKEEQVLFPAVRALEAAQGAASVPGDRLLNPIRVMRHEHDQAGDALAQLRSLSGGYLAPADGCQTLDAYYAGLQDLERDLHRHIHKENNVLFPRALALAGIVAPSATR